MAVNALGLPIRIQAGPLELQDLLGGIKVGDLLKARVVETLPDNKAVISLKGQNLVAELATNFSVQKGDLLPLQVTQMTHATAEKPAALTLRLLPPSASASTADSAPKTALPPQAILDQALRAARVPNNAVSQAVVRTLARLGVPLSPPAVAGAVQATQALLANEAAVPSTPPSLPLPLAETLQDALAQLKVAAQLHDNSARALPLQQAARETLAALQSQTPSALSDSSAVLPAPSSLPAAPTPSSPPSAPPLARQTPTSPQEASAGASQPSPPSSQVWDGNAPSTAPTAPQVLLPSFGAAVQNLIRDPNPQTLVQYRQALNAVLQAFPLEVSGQEAPAQTPKNLTATSTLPDPTPAPISSGLPSSAPASLQTPAAPATAFQSLVARETVIQLLAQGQSLTSTQAPSFAEFRQSIRTLQEAVQNPQSSTAQRLLAAVQVQAPAAQAAEVLENAANVLAQISARLDLQTQTRAPQAPLSLHGLIHDAGLPTPRLSLTTLPPETVAEAVAWLQARDLPPQRPLVEAVAAFLQHDHDALPAVQRAIQQTQALPDDFLNAHPALREAVENAVQALRQAEIQPESPGLAQRLQNWAQEQGLNLEARLAPFNADGPETPVLPKPTHPGLRPALQRLEQTLTQLRHDPVAQRAELASSLQSALREVQTANQTLNAIPLQVQAAPAFDTVHMPLPVFLTQDLGGRLSVTWRQGRERELSAKDPVSVAVSLNTGSLGTVKVLLQVWKDAASARVLAQDAATAEFLAAGGDELRTAFSDHTPFKLQSLDFGVDEERRPTMAEGPQAGGPGLTLSA